VKLEQIKETARIMDEAALTPDEVDEVIRLAMTSINVTTTEPLPEVVLVNGVEYRRVKPTPEDAA
jgi:hypothetical protein